MPAKRENRIDGDIIGNSVQANNIDYVIFGSPAPRPLPLAGPPVNDGFVGRGEDLTTIIRFLETTATTSTTNTMLVTGSPGVGKTSLVRQAGHLAQAQELFPGGVLYFDLDGFSTRNPITTEEAMKGLIATLHPEQKPAGESRGVYEVTIRSKFAQLETSGRPVLLILDNVANAEVAETLRPTGARHRLLVASRNMLPIRTARIITLSRLPIAEAVELVKTSLQIANPNDPRASSNNGDMAELAELCDRLPLALAIAAQILASDSAETIGTLAARLVEERDRLDELAFDDTFAVRAAFEISYARLSPTNARMFRLLSLNIGANATVSAAAALSGLRERVARQALTILLRAHMIERTPNQQTYQMHDLLQLFSGEKCKAEESTLDRTNATTSLVQYYLQHTLAVRAFVDPTVAKTRQHSTVFQHRKDAYSWLYLEMTKLPEAVQLAANLDLGATAVRFTQASYHIARLMGWKGWENAYLSTLDVATRHGSTMDQVDAFEYAGYAAMATGEPEKAVTYFHTASQLALSGGEPLRGAFAAYQLGQAKFALGDYEQAMAAFSEALDLQRHHGTAFGLARIFSAMTTACRSTGRLQQASRYALEYGRLRRIVGDRPGVGLGPSPQGAAVSRVELSVMKSTNSDHRLSLDYRRAFSDQYGDAHTYLNLAEAYEEAGQPTEARLCADESVRRFREIEAAVELDQAIEVQRRLKPSSPDAT